MDSLFLVKRTKLQQAWYIRAVTRQEQGESYDEQQYLLTSKFMYYYWLHHWESVVKSMLCYERLSQPIVCAFCVIRKGRLNEKERERKYSKKSVIGTVRLLKVGLFGWGSCEDFHRKTKEKFCLPQQKKTSLNLETMNWNMRSVPLVRACTSPVLYWLPSQADSTSLLTFMYSNVLLRARTRNTKVS